MNPLIAHYIDSLIPVAGGILCCYLGYGPWRTSQIANRDRAARILRFCGPLVVIFGVWRFYAEGPPATEWKRYATGDAIASAEFPGPPVREEKAIPRSSAVMSCLSYKVPYSYVQLTLSSNEVSPEWERASDEERRIWMRAQFAENGYKVISESHQRIGVTEICSVEAEHVEQKLRMRASMAIAKGRRYSVIAVPIKPGDRSDVLERFLDSFRIEQNGGPQ